MLSCGFPLASLRAPVLALAVGLLAAGPASALTFDLIHEFDGVEPDLLYATVDVVQNGNGVDLDFTVTLQGELGSGEDAHELYFNLIGTFNNLAITADNTPQTPYSVIGGSNPAGGAGSSFDHGVSFGNGGGPPGNGSLVLATFTLSADEALSVNDLLESSMNNNGDTVFMALHIQGTDTSPGSETVGGVVPEPSVTALAGAALALTSLRRRRLSAL